MKECPTGRNHTNHNKIYLFVLNLKDFSPKATPKPISRRRRLLILFRCIEARTGLARIQVVMTHDDGLRIIQPEREEQIQQRLLLRLGARVGRSALAVESAFVADADRVAVVVLAVGARLLFRSSGMDVSVARDIVMVADVTEVPVLHVVALAGLEAQALTLRRGRAVNDNQSDGSHTFFCVPLLILISYCKDTTSPRPVFTYRPSRVRKRAIKRNNSCLNIWK